MQHIRNIRLLAQGISVVPLCCAALTVDADQMMRALPPPVAAQPTAVQPRIQTLPTIVAPKPVVGTLGTQPISSMLPDMFIQEAILSYPVLNAEFHIVFPHQPGRNAIPLNLYPTAAVPAAQGKLLDSERRFPVLNCDSALSANLRVIVGNSGQKNYDGMPPQAGVTVTVAGNQYYRGFAPISTQQSQAVNLGAILLKPGTYAFGVVVNQGKTGGETNFANNVARGSFEIRCQGSSGPTQAATSRQITTEELSMTGQRVDARAITTGELSMTGQRVDARAITTGELSVTGQRIDARDITTGELSMTGQRVDARAITTSELSMTGQRDQSREVITDEITMTGRR